MVYNGRTKKRFLGTLFAISVVSNTIFSSEGFLYFQILLTLLILVTIFIQFKFKIDDGYLTYQILIMKMPIYQKVVYPNQIIALKFKRVGWANKVAIIQVEKGLNIRLVNFVPQNVFVALIDFANKYDISISKTKDYLILEKYY
ncbi:MAG: diguanylate cyclase [Bacillus sp. (in: Bacteria)]|nr:diguanylate cyclase [Bacillus sp. (in: firmicutes)]